MKGKVRIQFQSLKTAPNTRENKEYRESHQMLDDLDARAVATTEQTNAFATRAHRNLAEQMQGLRV